MKTLADLTHDEMLIVYQKNKTLRDQVRTYYKEVTQNYINTIVYPYRVTFKKEKFQLAYDNFEYDRLMLSYIKLIKLFELPKIELQNCNTIKKECNVILSNHFQITEGKLLEYYKDIFLSVYIQLDLEVTIDYILI